MAAILLRWLPCFSILYMLGAVGNEKLKVLPLFSSLWTVIWPFCSSTRRRQMARPTPEPPEARSRDLSARQNLSKTCGISAAAMPMPVSETAIQRKSLVLPSICWLCVYARMLTSPVVVWRRALLSRFTRICSMRAGSPQTGGRSGGVWW